jgi:hypothetical protein
MELRVVVTLMLMFWPTTWADGQSLREAPKRDGHASTTVNVFLGAASVDEVFSKADLVIHGIIADVKTHFTPDERDVVTDYTVSPMRVVKQDWTASTAKVPGQTRPLIVRCLGGTVVEGGARYTTYTNLYSPSEMFKAGEHAVLFLSWDERAKVYRLSHGPYAAFRVTREQVSAMTKQAANLRGDRPRTLETFLAELGRGAK